MAQQACIFDYLRRATHGIYRRLKKKNYIGTFVLTVVIIEICLSPQTQYHLKGTAG